VPHWTSSTIIIIIIIMQLEAAHAVEITKLVEYVDRKEDPLIQVLRTQQHNTDSAVLQTARYLKTEVQRNKKNEGQHSGENKRKMAREEDAWTIAT
jgi:hypothetical protein